MPKAQAQSESLHALWLALGAIRRPQRDQFGRVQSFAEGKAVAEGRMVIYDALCADDRLAYGAGGDAWARSWHGRIALREARAKAKPDRRRGHPEVIHD